MDSFVDTYFTEMLMREDDFPYTSQYFYISPDDNVLNSGPRWDYDKEFWRVAPTYGWDLFNLNYYFICVLFKKFFLCPLQITMVIFDYY